MCAMCYCCCFYARRRPTTQEQQGCAGGNNGLLIINLSIPENRISQQTTDIVLVFRRSDAECSVLGCVGAAACQCCYVVAKDHPSATNHPQIAHNPPHFIYRDGVATVITQHIDFLNPFSSLAPKDLPTCVFFI